MQNNLTPNVANLSNHDTSATNISTSCVYSYSQNKEILEHIEKTKDPKPHVRLAALKQMCPCRVKEDIDVFWNRVFEMVDDYDEEVRYQVLHTICDGSPKHLEQNVADALEKFNKDPNQKIRRQAHKILAFYSKTGKWNIL